MTHRERTNHLLDHPNELSPQVKEKWARQLKRWMALTLLSLAVVVASVLIGMAAIQGTEPKDAGLAPIAATKDHLPYPLVEADEAGWVRLSLSTFDDYAAHYYTYMLDDQPIEFFVIKSSDGIVRAAFNACDVCYRSLKGYSQDGQTMICNNCGSEFPADQINVVRGGCNPSPLERSVEEEYLVIPVEGIILGAIYF